jgi:hypothetical protein
MRWGANCDASFAEGLFSAKDGQNRAEMGQKLGISGYWSGNKATF